MNDIWRVAMRLLPAPVLRDAFAFGFAQPRLSLATGPLLHRKPVLRAFRPGLVPRDPWHGDDLPPRPAPRRVPSHLLEPPLSERERTAYVILAVIGLTPLVLLAVVVVLAHSPLFAN